MAQLFIPPLDGSHPLDPVSVIIIIVPALRFVAFPSADDVCTELYKLGTMRGRNVKVGITGHDGPGLQRSEPPLLEYRWIIEALRAVSKWMLNPQNSFKGVV